MQNLLEINNSVNSTDSNTNSNQPKPLLTIAKAAFQPLFSLFFTFFITFTVFPGLNIAWFDGKTTEGAFLAQLYIGLFQLCDVIGRFAPDSGISCLKVLNKSNSNALPICTVIRGIITVPCFVLLIKMHGSTSNNSSSTLSSLTVTDGPDGPRDTDIIDPLGSTPSGSVLFLMFLTMTGFALSNGFLATSSFVAAPGCLLKEGLSQNTNSNSDSFESFGPLDQVRLGSLQNFCVVFGILLGGLTEIGVIKLVGK